MKTIEAEVEVEIFMNNVNYINMYANTVKF